MLVPPEEFVPRGEGRLAQFRALLLESAPLRFVLLILSYIVLVGLALAYPRVARQLHAIRPDLADDGPAFASINGQNISRLDFFYALDAVRGPQVLRHLMERKAILEEAARDRVILTTNELDPDLQKITKAYKNMAVRGYFEEELRARLLLRKLLLLGATEEQEIHIYETFKAGLTQYELFDIALNTPADAQTVEAALKKGKPFSDLARRYSNDGRSRDVGGRYGWVTQPIVATAFGPAVAASMVHMKPGGYVRVVTEDQIIFLRVGGIRDSYMDLKPAVEDVLVEAGRVRLLYQLIQKSKVMSPYDRNDATPAAPARPLPVNPPVHGTVVPLPGNKPVHAMASPLPASKPVLGPGPVLPGNKPVQESASPLPGNTPGHEPASPPPGTDKSSASPP